MSLRTREYKRETAKGTFRNHETINGTYNVRPLDRVDYEWIKAFSACVRYYLLNISAFDI